MVRLVSLNLRRPSGSRVQRVRSAVLVGLVALMPAAPAVAQQPAEQIPLTLERLVELTLSSSYQVRFLNMNVDQTRLRLKAERAGLRSSVSLDVSAPDFQSVSESRWNSTIGRNEIVRENSRRLEAQLSVRQPLVLLGYPTNGYLSLNNRVYRYSQLENDGGRDVTYYNRYFVRYTQPLFQPNALRNNLERAELNYEDSEIDFYDDVMALVVDVSEDFLDLFENVYGQGILVGHVSNLELAVAAAQEASAADASRSLDLDQIRVELANARERLQSAQSQFRRETSSLKASLSLPEAIEITLDPAIEVRPLTIDPVRAIELARELTPRLRQLAISMRENEISLDETRGRGGFRVNLEFTYGREMRDPALRELWAEPANTYTVDMNATLPLWDWGQRQARIDAQGISLDRTRLRIDQTEADIVASVQSEIRNVEELQERVLAMRDNVSLAADLSRQSLERYRDGEITVLDLLQSLRRETDTADNFLDAYVGWRESILELQELTHYDFESQQPVLERFGIDVRVPAR